MHRATVADSDRAHLLGSGYTCRGDRRGPVMEDAIVCQLHAQRHPKRRLASNNGFKLRAAQDVLGCESPAPTVRFKPQLDPRRFR